MNTGKENSFLILKLIGLLFSVIGILLITFIVWATLHSGTFNSDYEFRGLLASAVILALATTTISTTIWWIVSHRKRFWVYE